jgi:hypothetical protein
MSSNLSQSEAEMIIQTLGDGVPIPDYVMEYSLEVDTPLLEKVKTHLDRVRRGISVARFIKGDYGSGKSHFLSLVREIALRDNFIVSSFDLRSREGFDMIERILGKLIKTISINEFRKGDVEKTVLDFIFLKWADKVHDTDEAVAKMPLDSTNIDFMNGIKIYGKLMSGRVSKLRDGINMVEIINRWFQGDSLRAEEKRGLNIINTITARNARDVINMLSLFFRSIGYSGWVILIDEQEIIPTLMSPQRRNLSNENLKVIIDTQPNTKYMYYLFATTPEFFTDEYKGINAYPALRQRVQDVLEVNPITKIEMIEAGKKIKEIFCLANPNFDRGLIYEEDIKFCSKYIDETYANISSKARVFIVSYIKLLNALDDNKNISPKEEFPLIVGRIWDELERKTRDAYSKFK